jgi:BirA family biotin operon repressor/biotin-[acetyl-CoA-carboxylase] ligase
VAYARRVTDAPPGPLLDRLAAGGDLVRDVRFVAETGSTNADLLALGPGAAGLVLVADVQTAGRGRRGRSWTAPPGTSLAVSMGLRPALPRPHWSLLPLAAGSAVLAACRAAIPDVDPGRLGLKWPNDLQVDGIKAAGILVEAGDDVAVVGVGVDVDWRGVARPDGLVCTSLAEVAGRAVDRWALLDRLVTGLAAAVRQAEVDPTGVVRRYVPGCATLGGAVIAHRDPPVTGTAVGLTAEGHLRIRGADGREVVLAAGDVEHLRPDPLRADPLRQEPER